MDPTLPMDITPNVGGRSPYLSPDSPYASSLPLSTIISALKAGGQGAVGAAQQGAQGGQQPTQAPAQPANNAPNYNQFGQNMVGGLGHMLQALGGNSPSFGGGI